MRLSLNSLSLALLYSFIHPSLVPLFTQSPAVVGRFRSIFQSEATPNTQRNVAPIRIDEKREGEGEEREREEREKREKRGKREKREKRGKIESKREKECARERREREQRETGASRRLLTSTLGE